MYEMYLPTDFDLATSNRLLQYQIDTFGGNSGSPVFVKDDMKAIGVHVLGGNVNSASVIGPLGNVFELYEGSFLAKTDPAFDMATKVPSRLKSFRVVSVPSKNERDSRFSNINRRTTTDSLIDSSSLFGSLRSLLDSTVRAHDDPEHFLGNLQSLLEPSMVNAMSDACNGAAGLVTALQFLWDSNKDSPTNTEALLTTLAKHTSTATRVGKTVIKHKGTILKVGKTIGERSPAGMVLRYGFDAASEIASSNNEGLMDHVATGLSVTVPMVDKELPKLGSIGGPIATLAASALRSVSSQAAAAVSSNSEPSSPSPESAPAQEGVLPGANERAILAETALHGIMHLDKSVLKQHQIYNKMHAIIKPLAPTIQRADLMLSSIMQPTITKIALASLATRNTSSDPSHGAADSSQKTADAAPGTPTSPQSPTVNNESLTYKSLSGVRPKIGVTVPSNNTLTAQATSQDSTAVDERISAFTEAFVAAYPDLEDTLPDMVNRGMQFDDGAFSNSTMFGLPILLGDGQESEYEDERAESAVAVTGLAQRAMLAEAALQVVFQLPVYVIKSLEIPDLKPTIDAFETEKVEGVDESGQSDVPPIITAVASSVSSIANSANAFLSHKDKLKDQEQKEKDQKQKVKDQQIAAAAVRATLVGQNMQAVKDGFQQPNKEVTRFDPKTKRTIEPGQDHPEDHPTGSGIAPPPRGGGSGATRGGSTAQHSTAGIAQPHTATKEPEHHGGEEGPDEHDPLPKQSAKALGKRPVESKPPVTSEASDSAAKLPSHPKPAVEPKPKEKEPKPKAEEPKHKIEEPKIEEPKIEEPKIEEPKTEEPKPKAEEPKPKAEEPKPKIEEPKPKIEEPKTKEPKPKVEKPPTTHQTAPIHDKPKEEEPKKAPHFSAPTASSAAKTTAKKRGGNAEGLLEENPESLIAEDFVSGFADI